MKATLLLLIGLASLMGAPLEPVSAIDFGPALHFTNAHPYLSIRYLAATSDGPTAIGGSEIAEIGIARANRGGSNVQVTRLQSSAGAIGRFAMRPDGSFWTMSQWDHPFTPVQPVLGGGDARTPVGPPVVVGDPTAAGSFPFNNTRSATSYDLHAPDGRRLESFRSFTAALDIAASANEVALVSGNLIRVGHVANGNFVNDRDWRVNGPHLVFPLDHDRFAVVNRMSGEFAIIDPSTPVTRTIAVPFKSPSRRDRLPVTAANGNIWFMVNGASGNTRDLVQLALDGSIVSRNTLRLAPGVQPRKIAISGRDVYLAGTTATVYRYELP